MKKRAELKGSEKQIAWAEDIRKPVLDAIDNEEALVSGLERVRTRQYKRSAKGINNGMTTAEIDELCNDTIGLAEYLTQIDSAKWWIDHREVFPRGEWTANVGDGSGTAMSLFGMARKGKDWMESELSDKYAAIGHARVYMEYKKER